MPDTGGLITSSAGPGALVTRASATGGTFAGVVAGSVSFGIIGSGALTLESAQTYSGMTVRSRGVLTLRDDASLLNTSAIELNAGTLSLHDSASLQTQLNNRLSDTAPLTLRAGSLLLIGRNKAAATETVGPVTAAMGANTFALTVNQTQCLLRLDFAHALKSLPFAWAPRSTL
jgi:autotransporter-associated beta strand protein